MSEIDDGSGEIDLAEFKTLCATLHVRALQFIINPTKCAHKIYRSFSVMHGWNNFELSVSSTHLVLQIPIGIERRARLLLRASCGANLAWLVMGSCV
eukprot:COSAG05_NODE_9328_length_631_cov_3.005639_3_plen_96_part_01